MSAEAPIHRSIVQYLRLALPGAVVSHAANEVRRGGRRGHINRAANVGMGVVAGYPDLAVHVSGGGTVFFEVKAADGRVSPAQAEMHERLTALGFRVGVVRSIDDVELALRHWGIETRVGVAS